MDGKDLTPSDADRAIRERSAAIVARVANGAKPLSAIGASGYTRKQASAIMRIGGGGDPSVTDESYRDACMDLVQRVELAAAEQDAALAERWRTLAMEGDDWRSIAELLKRRNPDEWAVTEKSEVTLDADVNMRSEDAVLGALARLRGEDGDRADGDARA